MSFTHSAILCPTVLKYCGGSKDGESCRPRRLASVSGSLQTTPTNCSRSAERGAWLSSHLNKAVSRPDASTVCTSVHNQRAAGNLYCPEWSIYR